MVALFLVALAVHGEVPGAGSEAVLPTEESEPPFEVGQLANQAGYTIDLEEGMQLNFRMVGTQLRVYWLDADGLVVEPLSTAGTIRFRKSIRGKKLFQLRPVSGDVALGHPQFIPYPHTFNPVLNLKDAETGELKTYAFRYTQSMSTPTPARTSPWLRHNSSSAGC